MLQIRRCMFETNSSSACVFSVISYRPDAIKIPKTVKIDSRGDSRLDGYYRYVIDGWAVAFDDTNSFFTFLLENGVEEIFVDGAPVTVDKERATGFHSHMAKEDLMASFFAEGYESFSEWESWGSEIEDSPAGINYLDGYRIQQMAKDPNYVVKVFDGDTDEEIPWEECPLAKQEFKPEWIERLKKDAEAQEQRKKEWEEYKTAFQEKWGIDLDTFDEIYEESSEQIAEEEYSSDDDYYEALQEKMTQEVLKRKK